jgi:hypothetical protein
MDGGRGGVNRQRRKRRRREKKYITTTTTADQINLGCQSLPCTSSVACVGPTTERRMRVVCVFVGNQVVVGGGDPFVPHAARSSRSGERRDTGARLNMDGFRITSGVYDWGKGGTQGV